LLGETFKQYHQQHDFMQYMNTILWFSYRKNFPGLLDDSKYTTDRGWGCMLRTGQMMFAELIKRHFFFKNYEKMRLPTKDELFELISYFADYTENEYEKSPFGIQNISKIASESFKMNPGEWYKATTIVMTLEKLCEMYPIKATQNMKFAVFIEGTIYEDQILEQAFGLKPESTQDNDKEEEKTNAIITPINRTDEWKNSVFLFVASKTGLDAHNPIYLPTIKELLKFRQSLGILGGNGTSAHYIVGLNGDDVLFLDPHFVQESAKKKSDLIDTMSTYFVKNPFQMKLSDMDTSVGFGFYIRNAEDYVYFKSAFYKCQAEDAEFLIGFEERTPKYTYCDSDVKVMVEIDDDDFELIQ